MEGNTQDTSGKGNNGTASGNPAYGTGPNGYGKALKFDGLDDYVTLPIGSLLSSLNNITVATWVNYSGTGGGWQRIWDFGTGTDELHVPDAGPGHHRLHDLRHPDARRWRRSGSSLPASCPRAGTTRPS